LSFVFVASLLLGLAMAATSGLLRRIAARHLRQQVTMPAPEHHSAVRNLAIQRASLVVTAFGIGGMAVRHSASADRLLVAAVAAMLAGLVALFALRPACPPRTASLARVVRAIGSGGYGQVEVAEGKRIIVLAAKSADGRPIPSGAEVEVLDCESSVLTVRLPGAGPPAG